MPELHSDHIWSRPLNNSSYRVYRIDKSLIRSDPESNYNRTGNCRLLVRWIFFIIRFIVLLSFNLIGSLMADKTLTLNLIDTKSPNISVYLFPTRDTLLSRFSYIGTRTLGVLHTYADYCCEVHHQQSHKPTPVIGCLNVWHTTRISKGGCKKNTTHVESSTSDCGNHNCQLHEQLDVTLVVNESAMTD